MGSATNFDVVVMGGALAGASTALLLRQQQPGLRVLVVEKTPEFGRRVGEATVEVSAYFLTRVLALTQYLNETQLVKQGFRFWFANASTQSLPECAEVGGKYLARVPAFQLDRSKLDEEVLRRAVASGVELLRPATVQKIELAERESQRLLVRAGERSLELTARWVVDASGVAAVLARQHGWWHCNSEHPTASVWARWQGVKDLDGAELCSRYPDWAQSTYGMRQTATNHFMGDGWWAWMIPLKGGDVSVGVVYDQRLVEWPAEGSPADRLKTFLCRHPAARELLHQATCVQGDVHSRRNLAYSSSRLAGDGYILVGDAAGFLDPLYSPGLDWLAFTCYSGAQLIARAYRGESVEPLVQKHNQLFTQSYTRWFEAIYRDKYDYVGELDLMRLAFTLDLGLYYLGVASQPYKAGPLSFTQPVFSTPPSAPVFHLMRCYNRRLAAVARERRRQDRLGQHHQPGATMLNGYTFELTSSWPVLRGLFRWAWLELTEGWRSWFSPERTLSPVAAPVDPTSAPPAADSHLDSAHTNSVTP